MSKALSKLNTIILAAIIIVAAVAVVVVYLWWPQGGPEEAPKVLLGMTGGFTGTMAMEARECRDGIIMAIDEINAEGGLLGEYEIEWIAYDIGDFEAALAITAAEKMCTVDEVDFAISAGTTTLTSVEIETYNDYGVPYILSANSMSTNAIIGTQGDEYRYIVSTQCMLYDFQTQLPEACDDWEDQGLITFPEKKVALIQSDNPYCEWVMGGLRDSFIDHGWSITLDELVPLATIVEWGAVLAQIRSDPPELIVLEDYNPVNEVAFINQFLEDPINSLIFVEYGPNLPEFTDLLGSDSDGIMYHMIGVIASPDWAPYVELKDKWLTKYGYLPGDQGMMAYSGVKLWEKAVEITGDPFDRDAVADAFLEVEMVSVAGIWEVDPETRLTKHGSDYVPCLQHQLWDEYRYTTYPETYKDLDLTLPPWFT